MALSMLKRRGGSPATRIAYRDLVFLVANGGSPADEKIFEAIEGRSLEQFQADVKTARQRIEAVRVLRGIPAEEAATAKLEEAYRAAKAKFDQLVADVVHAEREAMIAGGCLMDFRSTVQHKKGDATNLLIRTATKSIGDRILEIQATCPRSKEISPQILRDKQAAESHVVSLPSQIAAMAKKGTPEAAVERAMLAVKLAATEAALKEINELIAEARNVESEAAKIQVKMDAISAERFLAENMEVN